MQVIIDFGTSRTAIAVFNPQWGWQPLGQPVRYVRKVSNPGWSAITYMIGGMINIHVETLSVPLVITYSSYCKIDNLVIPISISGSVGAIQFPAGSTVVPPLASEDGQFVSVKENQEVANDFLGAITEMVYTWAPPGADWIIGQTCRSIINPQALNVPPGTRVFNEGAAVIFSLVSVASETLLHESKNKFVVVADLGGGFLDICVAHKVIIGERNGSAEIVNYGGYPIGVDRISLRFSHQRINNPEPLIKLIVTAIAYHIVDYCDREKAQQSNYSCVVFLTGGGFNRIDSAYRRVSDHLIPLVRQVKGIDVTVDRKAGRYDSKLLTITGLARMASLDWINMTHGDDISEKDPRHHGKTVLEYQNMKLGPYVMTWWGLLQAELRAAYRG